MLRRVVNWGIYYYYYYGDGEKNNGDGVGWGQDQWRRGGDRAQPVDMG